MSIRPLVLLRRFETFKHLDFVMMCLLGVLALIPRLVGLGDRGFWIDEISITLWSLAGPRSWFYIINMDPPLTYVLHYLFFQVAVNEFMGRLPEAIFGAISVSATYFFGYRIFTRRVGILASVLVAISGYHFFYSQEGMFQIRQEIG